MNHFDIFKASNLSVVERLKKIEIMRYLHFFGFACIVFLQRIEISGKQMNLGARQKHACFI